MARRPCLLLAFGLLLLIAVQALHFADVLGITARTPLAPWSAVIRANITPFAWCAYLVFLMGLLSFLDGRSYIARYRNRIAVCWLWSIPAWCYFDWMNFYFMRDPHTGLRAWEYINLPTEFVDRLVGYLIAFGAIAPGMFLTAATLQRLGLHKLRTKASPVAHGQLSIEKPIGNRRWAISNSLPLSILLFGLLLAPIPILIGTPASNLAIWVGTWAVLDPINLFLHRPSIIADWQAGRFGRFLSLFLAGLLCGFLWEFWNFWSFTKWVYHLPFLGSWEHHRYFEMPLLGLIGFPAFALETWAMWQTTLFLLHPFVEGESKAPADQLLHEEACV